MKIVTAILLIVILTTSIFSTSVFAADTTLSISNNVYNKTPSYGSENYQYISVKNNGSDNASNVIANTTVSPAFNVIEWWVSWDNQVTYVRNDASFNPTTGIWNIGNLANGKTVFLDIRMLMNRTGTFTKNATATANNANPVSKAFTTTVPTSLTPNINLGLTSAFNYTSRSPGAANTLKITITNPSSSTATGVIINDGMPAGLNITSWRVGINYPIIGWIWTNNPTTYNPWTGIWNLGDFDHGFLGLSDTRQLEINFITPLTAGYNQVISTIYGRQNDTILSNNYYTASFTVTAPLTALSESQARTFSTTESDLNSNSVSAELNHNTAPKSLNIDPVSINTAPGLSELANLQNQNNLQNLNSYHTNTGLQISTEISEILSNLLKTILDKVPATINSMLGMLSQIIFA